MEPSQADFPRDARPGEPSLPAGAVRRAIATLDPGYFALVMATGIVSVGTDLLGYQTLSQALFAIAVVAFIVLTLAYGARILWCRPWLYGSLKDPTTAMAYFSVVAGTDVLAVRLAMAGHDQIGLWLAVPAAGLWLVLNYGLPWSIVTTARRPVLGDFNGTWLIWVVATQSLAIVAASVASAGPWGLSRADLASVATGLWGVGVMLYLILIVLIFMRLMLVEVTPAEMGPAYWITMGATAISVRAAAGILEVPAADAGRLLAGLRPFLIGVSFTLWAFGTWWIPLLLLFGLWRHVLRGYPAAYEPRLWSVVFPIGMYTVASDTLGRATGLSFLISIAQVWVWVGVGAWSALFMLMGVSLWRAAMTTRKVAGGS